MGDRVAEIQQRNLELLFRQLEQAEEAQPKLLVTEVTNITRAIAQLTAEMRKREVHDKDLVMSLSPEDRDLLVRAYIENLPKERRRALVQELQALDAKELLLG